MTAEQLINEMNKAYGLNPWPKSIEVDAETYGNCCQYVFNNAVEKNNYYRYHSSYIQIDIAIGNNNGLMFKNVELILKT